MQPLLSLGASNFERRTLKVQVMYFSKLISAKTTLGEPFQDLLNRVSHLQLVILKVKNNIN